MWFWFCTYGFDGDGDNVLTYAYVDNYDDGFEYDYDGDCVLVICTSGFDYYDDYVLVMMTMYLWWWLCFMHLQ